MKNASTAPLDPRANRTSRNHVSARKTDWNARVGVGIGAVLLTVLGPVPAIRAEIALGRGSLGLTADVVSEYDSNIYSNRSETADWHSVLTPSAKFIRDAGLLRVDAKAGVQLQHFQSNNRENSTDPFLQLDVKRANQDPEENKFDAAFETFWRRRSEANVDLNARTRVEEFDVKASFKHFPLEKVGYKVAAEFFNQDFLSRGISDIRTKSIDGEGRYHFSPKADVFVGTGGRWSENHDVAAGSPAFKSEDVKFKLGLDGEILPKVTGRVAAGYVKRRFRTAGGGTQSGALFDTSLQWQPDNESALKFTLNRDLDTTPVDQSVTRLIAGVEAWRQIREKVQVSLGFSHAASKYVGVGLQRQDDTYTGTAGVAYSFTNRFKGGLRLSYATTDSNFAVAKYDRFIGGLSFAAAF